MNDELHELKRQAVASVMRSDVTQAMVDGVLGKLNARHEADAAGIRQTIERMNRRCELPSRIPQIARRVRAEGSQR